MKIKVTDNLKLQLLKFVSPLLLCWIKPPKEIECSERVWTFFFFKIIWQKLLILFLYAHIIWHIYTYIHYLRSFEACRYIINWATPSFWNRYHTLSGLLPNSRFPFAPIPAICDIFCILLDPFWIVLGSFITAFGLLLGYLLIGLILGYFCDTFWIIFG